MDYIVKAYKDWKLHSQVSSEHKAQRTILVLQPHDHNKNFELVCSLLRTQCRLLG